MNDDALLEKVIALVKDRCPLLTDFVPQAAFFFNAPESFDWEAVRPKWNDKKQLFFVELIRAYQLISGWQHDDLEKEFKEMAAAHQIKAGDLLLPFRVMLVGGKFGPGVFDIATLIGREETIARIETFLKGVNG